MRLLVAITLALAPLAGGSPIPARQAADEDGPRIELRTDLVLVNVVAKRGNAWAQSLARTDFSLAEDGVPQELAFFGAEETPFAAAILLDVSGSMEHRFSLARTAAARFLDRTRPEDQVAVYTLGSDVRRIQDFTPGRRDITDAIWDTAADSTRSKIYDCLDEAAAALATRAEQRRAILLLSDGADHGSGASFDAALRRVLAAGVTLYTIDFAPVGGKGTTANGRDLVARGVLRGLAEKSGGRFFASRGGSDLNDAFAEIIDELGHQYTLGFYSSNPRRDGRWRRIELTSKQPGVTLRARPGYNAPKE
jgi:Ca-activated chloride channel family protein